MGVLSGHTMVIKVSNTAMTSASEGTKVENLDSSTYNSMVEILEVNSFGDEFKRRKSGISDTSLSLSGSFNPEDAGQIMLKAGAPLFVATFPEGLAKPGTQIEMIIESVEKSAEATGKQDISIELLGNGAPTVIPVI